MGERFLKHPPRSQIERVLGGDQPILISVYASAVQYLWVERRPNLAPVLLTLLAYDFFLNF